MNAKLKGGIQNLCVLHLPPLLLGHEWLEAGLMKQIKMAIARQQCSKHISTAMNQHVMKEELLEAGFCMWPMLRL
jgi:hypothetical protein